ncbi:MAG: DNA gyrase C-terminal beta-propeller domain-containing protein [Candidatus Riflemargulisbacteria bacterium]
MNREFQVIIEKDEDGILIAEVPALKGCHTQANTMDVLMVSSNGMVIRFDEEQVRSVGRTARGVRGMRLRSKDIIVGNSIINPDAEKESLLMIASTGIGKRTQVNNFRVQNRAGIGVIGIKLKIDDKLAGGLVVQPDDEVMIVSSKGTVSRQLVKFISSQGRSARGVKVQKLDDSDSVVAFAKLLQEDGEASPE